MAAVKIKLSCSTCNGEVVYVKEKPSDDEVAHKRLHAADCAFKKTDSPMWWVAEHGLPVEAVALETVGAVA